MNQFIQQYGEEITGVLSGYDRFVIRGTLRSLMFTAGIMGFLSKACVLVKDFGAYAERTTASLKEASLEAAERLGRPIELAEKLKKSKEDFAREMAEENGITDGLICILKAQEKCTAFKIHKNRETGERELKPRTRVCQHLYHYWMHPVFGFMNARIQTWFPFTIQVCLNGREWLARKMDLVGMRYQRYDNSFTWLEEVQGAQKLMDEFVRLPWQTLLRELSRQLNPIHREIFRGTSNDYYWTIQQSEWATDVMFRRPKVLHRIAPVLARGALFSFSTSDILHFFGHKPHGNRRREVSSDYKVREEGLRVKHWEAANSLKFYDKGANLLRSEITLNDPNAFKCFRRSAADPKGPPDWRPLRKGLVDIRRRA